MAAELRKIDLVEEGADLAFRIALSLDDTLIARKLKQVSFQLVAALSFLTRRGRPKTLSDLYDAPFLVYTQMATGGRIRYGEGALVNEASRAFGVAAFAYAFLHAILYMLWQHRRMAKARNARC